MGKKNVKKNIKENQKDDEWAYIHLIKFNWMNLSFFQAKN
jgi:hypothetical protein